MILNWRFFQATLEKFDRLMTLISYDTLNPKCLPSLLLFLGKLASQLGLSFKPESRMCQNTARLLSFNAHEIWMTPL